MRKVVGVVVALVFGIVGAGMLAAYVKSAREEIRGEESMVTVYVAGSDVPAGATIEDALAGASLVEVPSRLVAPGAVDATDDVSAGLVSDAPIHAGEQVIASRFVQPHELVAADVPAGRQEVTLRLDPERAVGGLLEPGSVVGVIVSLDVDEPAAGTEADAATDAAATAAVESAAAPRGGQMTQLVLQHVLVTNMQFTSPDDAAAAALIDAATEETTTFTPTAPVLVTVALTSQEAEQVVFASEFGTVWLTLEGPGVDDAGQTILSGLDVYALSGGDR